MGISELWTQWAAAVNANAQEKGFWKSPPEIGTKIALIHSEIAEAAMGCLEGNLASDKIPGFSQAEEELADAVIRIFDTAVHYKWLNVPSLAENYAANPFAWFSRLGQPGEREFDRWFSRVHVHLSEALEGSRKSSADEAATQIQEGLAKALAVIQMMCTQNNWALGAAIAAKHAYNTKRPYMHGKTF